MKPKKPVPVHVILSLLCFWPVGLYVLYKHLTSDKTDVTKNAKVVQGFGIGITVFGALCFAVAPSSTQENGKSGALTVVLMGAVFLVIGILILLRARVLKKLVHTHRKYLDIIANQKIYLLDEISRLMAMDYRTVVNDLKKMIDMGFFAVAYIDETGQRIVVQETTVDVADIVRVQCKNCGANNSGHAKKCEYCDSSLTSS